MWPEDTVQMLALRALVREALLEDIGQGDVTTVATVSEADRCRAQLFAKQEGVLSGIEVFRAVFDELNAAVEDWSALSDAARFARGQEIASFTGLTRAVLSGERVALNFLQRLCGIATLTAAFVAKLNGLPARVCDTRKTTPLMRRLEKQAVVHGGGANHRYALYDGVLIKENHIAAAGGVARAVERAVQGTHHLMKIGVEAGTLEEVDEAVAAGADSVLLDNMPIDRIAEAVRRTRGKKVVIEASGNVNLQTVRAIAETGVDLISVGALTHSAPAVDLSLVISRI
jgi:nicotinate-nucleotide pyrophosphorylase (carboxylating)